MWLPTAWRMHARTRPAIGTMALAATPPLRRRLAAVVPVCVARVLVLLPPRRLCAVLRRLRRGTRPATREDSVAARDAVMAISARCAGHASLQRSVATALLCRLHGAWPTWSAGVRSVLTADRRPRPGPPQGADPRRVPRHGPGRVLGARR